VTANTFALTGSVGNAAYTSGGYAASAGRWRRQDAPVVDAAIFDVTAFGAVGGGASSPVDIDAINAAKRALAAAGGGVLYLPQGTYAIHDQSSVGLVLNASDMTIRGDGRDKTVLKAAGTTTNLVTRSTSATSYTNLTIEDLTFDGNDQVITLLLVSGQYNRGIRIRRCRFVNFSDGYGLLLQDTAGLTVEDCLFESLSPPTGNGILVSEGASHIEVRRSIFRYLVNGIQLDANGDRRVSDATMIRDLLVEDCRFDGGWFHLPVRVQGTATFTDTSMTDSGATFTSLSPAITNQTTIRVMREMKKTPAATPTLTSAGFETALVDSNATFTTYELVPGDIVRSGSKFAILMGIESDTVLRIEEWLDDTTRQQVAPPANAASYTVYKTYHGACYAPATTATSLTIYGTWTDRLGNEISGATFNGAEGEGDDWLEEHEYNVGDKVYWSNHSYEALNVGRSGLVGPSHIGGDAFDYEVEWRYLGFDERAITYELLPNHPNYQGVHTEYNSRDIRIVNNVFLRSWSDQISLYGDRNLVSGNRVEDGQDTGITVNCQLGLGHSTIVGNHVRHQGVCGIFCTADHSLIASNVCTRNQWHNTYNDLYSGDMTLGGTALSIQGNLCDGEEMPQSFHGIVLTGAEHCLVANNKVLRHQIAGLKDYDQDLGAAAPVAPFPRHFANLYVHNDTTGEEPGKEHVQDGLGARVTQNPTVDPAGTPSPAATLTLSGGPTTPNVNLRGRVKITVGGSLGTAQFQYSENDGVTYSANVATASSVSSGSIGGATAGITLAFSGTMFSVGTVWLFTAANGGYPTLHEHLQDSPVGTLAASSGSTVSTNDGVVYTYVGAPGDGAWAGDENSQIVVSFAGDANEAVSEAEVSAHVLFVTSSTLTAMRDLELPIVYRTWLVHNGTTGGQSIRLKPVTGGGAMVTIANGATKLVFMRNGHLFGT